MEEKVINRKIKKWYEENNFEKIGQLIFSKEARSLKMTKDNSTIIIDVLIRLGEWSRATDLLNQLPDHLSEKKQLELDLHDSMEKVIEQMKEQQQNTLSVVERYQWYESWSRLPNIQSKYDLSRQMLLEKSLTKAERADYLSMISHYARRYPTENDLVQYYDEEQFKSIRISELTPLDETPYWKEWPNLLNDWAIDEVHLKHLLEQEFRMMLIDNYPELQHLGSDAHQFFEEWVSTLEWMDQND